MNDDLEKRLLRVGERIPVPCPDGIKGCLVAHYSIETNPVCREAAATIASLRAEIERAKLDAVREGIEASADFIHELGPSDDIGNWEAAEAIRALDAEAIAKGEG